MRRQSTNLLDFFHLKLPMAPATDIPDGPLSYSSYGASPLAQTEVFSQLLLSLYASTFDESQWSVFLDQLCAATASKSAFFMRNDAALGNQVLASGGIPVPSPEAREYSEGRSYTDPVRDAYMRNPRIGVIEGEEIIPNEKLRQSEIYAPIIKARGWMYMTCVVLSLTPRTQQLISLWRGPDRVYLEPHQRELLELLLPHLQNAVRIRQTLGQAETRALNAEAALDASTTGSILLDQSGRILHMNHTAQQMALAEDAFRVDISHIVPTDPQLRAPFKGLVAATADLTLQHPGGALSLTRRRGKPHLNLLITPLRLPQSRRATARVLLLLSDPTQPVAFPDAVLRSLYALTPAETEIANGLLTGLSLEEIARLRAVSLATVRTQLKTILAKTDTRRQADLVRLLATLPHTAPPLDQPMPPRQ
jgi:DNA-binding CsgD family transcriptional regulator/PAS domain-containing protein